MSATGGSMSGQVTTEGEHSMTGDRCAETEGGAAVAIELSAREVLLAAVTLIRVRAEAAEHLTSPWAVASGERAWLIGYTTDNPQAGLVAECADYVSMQAADHIAGWHPAAALAVADHLAHVAERHQAVEVRGQDDAWSACRACGVDMDEDTDCPDLAAALNVANAYLGPQRGGFSDG